MKLTKRVLDNAKPHLTHDVFLWDDEAPGFGLRIKPTGVRSLFFNIETAAASAGG